MAYTRRQRNSVSHRFSASFCGVTGTFLLPDEKAAAVPIMVDMRKAVWFTVQRVELLKGLSTLEGDIFKHGFYLDIRVRNILDHLNLIRIKLEENPAVKSVRQSACV